MNRREVLAGTGVIVAGGLAGCTGPDNGDGEPTDAIVRFSITNEDDVQRSIRIEIQADGEMQASGEGTIPPAGEQQEPFRYGFPSIGVPVSAVIQSDSASRSVQWNPAECSELHVGVRIVDGDPVIEENCQ